MNEVEDKNIKDPLHNVVNLKIMIKFVNRLDACQFVLRYNFL